jgi:hypothetical protein
MIDCRYDCSTQGSVKTQAQAQLAEQGADFTLNTDPCQLEEPDGPLSNP